MLYKLSINIYTKFSLCSTYIHSSHQLTKGGCRFKIYNWSNVFGCAEYFKIKMYVYMYATYLLRVSK